MSDYLTPWHRECIARGATLLVIPVEPQPTRDTVYLTPKPITPGDVLEVAEYRLRCTDVAVNKLNFVGEGEIRAGRPCEQWDGIWCCIDSGLLCMEDGCDCGEYQDGCESAREAFLNGIRQSHPEFPADGHVWLVSIEREE